MAGPILHSSPGFVTRADPVLVMDSACSVRLTARGLTVPHSPGRLVNWTLFDFAHIR